MFQVSHPEVLRQLAAERHESLRRSAGASRLHREAKAARASRRRRRRAGPDR